MIGIQLLISISQNKFLLSLNDRIIRKLTMEVNHFLFHNGAGFFADSNGYLSPLFFLRFFSCSAKPIAVPTPAPIATPMAIFFIATPGQCRFLLLMLSLHRGNFYFSYLLNFIFNNVIKQLPFKVIILYF